MKSKLPCQRMLAGGDRRLCSARTVDEGWSWKPRGCCCGYRQYDWQTCFPLFLIQLYQSNRRAVEDSTERPTLSIIRDYADSGPAVLSDLELTRIGLGSETPAVPADLKGVLLKDVKSGLGSFKPEA